MHTLRTRQERSTRSLRSMRSSRMRPDPIFNNEMAYRSSVVNVETNGNQEAVMLDLIRSLLQPPACIPNLPAALVSLIPPSWLSNLPANVEAMEGLTPMVLDAMITEKEEFEAQMTALEKALVK